MKSNIYFESILKLAESLGGKKKGDAIEFVRAGLLIRDKKTKHEYTVEKVTLASEDGKPRLKCYRYYGPNNDKRAYLILDESDFDSYERV